MTKCMSLSFKLLVSLHRRHQVKVHILNRLEEVQRRRRTNPKSFSRMYLKISKTHPEMILGTFEWLKEKCHHGDVNMQGISVECISESSKCIQK